MKKVAQRLNILTMSPAEQKAYNEFIHNSLKERDYIVSAEEKGREEGRQEGREEGRLSEKLAIARGMVAKGLDRSLIKEITGLSDQEIESI